MPMVGCISLPLGIASDVEERWENAGIAAECFSSGCGTAEYKFKTLKERRKALKIVVDMAREFAFDMEA